MLGNRPRCPYVELLAEAETEVLIKVQYGRCADD